MKTDHEEIRAVLQEPLPKLPPHSPEIEAEVLGCILHYPDECGPQIERLGINRNSFYELRHRNLFDTIKAVMAEGKVPSELIVAQRLSAESKMQDAGGWERFGTLPEGWTALFERHVTELHDLRQRRELIKQASCIQSRAYDLTAPIAGIRTDLEHVVTATDSNNGLPEIEDMNAFLAADIPEPPQLIYGVLHQGSKMVLGGGSKTYKTWTLTDLAISVAAGEPWLSWKTTKSKVLFVNFEMFKFAFQKRARAICQSKNIALPKGTIDVWNLRSFVASYTVLFPRILDRIKKSNYAMIVLDPIYKTYGDTDENAAGAVAMLMNGLEQLSAQTGAAVVFGAHYAKGNAASKEAIDRISGSGVFARDPDTIINVTRHEVDEAFTIEATLRNFKPMEPFVVRWIYPLMRRDEDLDPTQLKQKPGRKKRYTLDKLIACLDGNTLSTRNWFQIASSEIGVPKTQFYQLLEQARNHPRIKQTPDGKWVYEKGESVPEIPEYVSDVSDSRIPVFI